MLNFSQFRDPVALLAKLVILLVALPIHEFSHAWTAEHLGDPMPIDWVMILLRARAG